MAVLAITPKTHTLRMALWPVVALLTLRATVYVDMSPGEPDKKARNTFLLVVSIPSVLALRKVTICQVSMFLITARTFDWTLQKEPFVRHLCHAKSPRSIIMDALDLATTMRGDGWDWSRGVYIPRETRPTDRKGFAFHVVLSTTFHSLISGIFHNALKLISPAGFGSPSGESIFDETLPFHAKYLRASVISALTVVAIYAGIQTWYDTCTIIGVFILGQDPAQWPPAFDAPWRATSLSDLWGRRWHQFFRRLFIVQGGYPFSLVLGKAGLIIGTFLCSGFLHHMEVLLFKDGEGPWRLLVGFGMMGVVVLAERMFKQATGRKVGGVVGWIWTMGWLLVLGNFIIDAFARGGVFGHFGLVQGAVPGRDMMQRLVTNFDAWLHAI